MNWPALQQLSASRLNAGKNKGDASLTQRRLEAP
jgi:hypothetical protein